MVHPARRTKDPETHALVKVRVSAVNMFYAMNHVDQWNNVKFGVRDFLKEGDDPTFSR